MYYDAVSFPGLGIGQIKLNPTAISITENINIQWYAIFIVIGIVVAYFVCNNMRSKFGIKEDDFLDCILFAIPIAFVGARLTYVLGDLDSFHSFMDVIAIWNGGLAIYGGVVFAAVSVVVICKIKKCNFASMLDVMAVGLLIGQMIGRIGNFVNIEVYGVETTLPWAMGIGYYGYGEEILVHPLFLYEILWNLIGFILIYGYKNMRKFNGEVFLWYMAWYGLGRALMEPLRDSQYNLTLFGVRIMLVFAIAMFVLASAGVLLLRRKTPTFLIIEEQVQQEADTDIENDYENQFLTEDFNEEKNEFEENDDEQDN